mgnify:FL=1
MPAQLVVGMLAARLSSQPLVFVQPTWQALQLKEQTMIFTSINVSRSRCRSIRLPAVVESSAWSHQRSYRVPLPRSWSQTVNKACMAARSHALGPWPTMCSTVRRLWIV